MLSPKRSFSDRRWIFQNKMNFWSTKTALKCGVFQITSGNFSSQWHPLGHGEILLNETSWVGGRSKIPTISWSWTPFFFFFLVALCPLSFASQDFEVIRPILPKMKGTPEKPAYVPSATHLLPTFTAFNMTPGLTCWGAVDGRNPAPVDK